MRGLDHLSSGLIDFPRKNGQPRRDLSQPGLSCRILASGPVSRILSCAVIPLDAVLPRTFISDLPGGFGVPRMAAPCRASSADLSEPPGRTGPIRNVAWLLRRFPPYLVLLRVGFTLPPALPSERCALTAPFHPYPSGRTSRPGEPDRSLRWPSAFAGRWVAEAVYSLWHWPSMSLDAHGPDVIRHTALRSSDFPPPVVIACATPPAATARSSCQVLV